jgi:hypothetical protein
LGQSD